MMAFCSHIEPVSNKAHRLW